MEYRGSLHISILPDDPGWVKVVVRDSGPGIPPELQDKIFEHLFTTKPLGKGTGMGLHICRKIVAEHGGSLTVKSEPGNTEFITRLPLQ
jgi:signal transduction histidine kinase